MIVFNINSSFKFCLMCNIKCSFWWFLWVWVSEGSDTAYKNAYQCLRVVLFFYFCEGSLSSLFAWNIRYSSLLFTFTLIKNKLVEVTKLLFMYLIYIRSLDEWYSQLFLCGNLSQTLSFRDFSWVALGFGIPLTDTCMIWIVYCSVLSFSTELCIAIVFFRK